MIMGNSTITLDSPAAPSVPVAAFDPSTFTCDTRDYSLESQVVIEYDADGNVVSKESYSPMVWDYDALADTSGTTPSGNNPAATAPAKPAPTHLDKDHGFIITGPEGMETSYQVSVVDRHAGKGPQLFIKDPVTSERFSVIAVFPDRLNRLKLTKSTKYNGDPERPGAVVCYGEKYQEGPELNKFMPTQVMRGMVLVAEEK
jgi:hypothetical protein